MLAKRFADRVTLASVTTAAGAIAAGTGDAVHLPGMVNGFAFELDVTAALKCVWVFHPFGPGPNLVLTLC